MISLLVFHLTVTWALIGLIWTIQVVHYPLLKNVGQNVFVSYHERHMARISWVVGPLMLAEAGSAGLLLYFGERSLFFLIGLAMMASVWISTIFSQIPLHEKLTQGFSSAIIDHLVRTNWGRTIAWTLRGFCIATLLILKIT